MAGWIDVIEASLLTGPMKSWVLNHSVCSKAQWMLMVHDLQLGQIDKWKDLFHRKFRNWMGLAKSCEPSVLYRSTRNFGLNFHQLREYTKRIRVTRMQLLKCSLNPKIRSLYDYLLERDKRLRGVTSSLRRYIPPKKRISQLPPTLELERALQHAKFLKVKSNCQTSKRGVQVRSFGPGVLSSESSMTQRKLVSSSLKQEAELKRMQYLYIRQYDMQTNWLTILDKVISDDFNWQRMLYGYSSRLLKFVINLRANTLPSPDNLRRWNIKGTHVCGLCEQQNVTLNHILNGCRWVFEQNKLERLDRYTWRHNGVLRVLVNFLWRHILKCKDLKSRDTVKKKVKFVTSGKAPRKKTAATGFGILLLAQDWLFHIDLPEFIEAGTQYRVPHDIILTNLKPDLLLISWKQKIIIIIEITSPNDNNLEYWRKKKRDKYDKLKRWVAYGWACHVFSLEVSSRGFVQANSFYELCAALGIEGPNRKSLRNSLSKIALRCSYVVWINRFNKKMYKRALIPCDIDHRFRFSKAINAAAEANSKIPIMDSKMVGDLEATPIVAVQNEIAITTLTSNDNFLESWRFSPSVLPKIKLRLLL